MDEPVPLPPNALDAATHPPVAAWLRLCRLNPREARRVHTDATMVQRAEKGGSLLTARLAASRAADPPHDFFLFPGIGDFIPPARGILNRADRPLTDYYLSLGACLCYVGELVAARDMAALVDLEATFGAPAMRWCCSADTAAEALVAGSETADALARWGAYDAARIFVGEQLRVESTLLSLMAADPQHHHRLGAVAAAIPELRRRKLLFTSDVCAHRTAARMTAYAAVRQLPRACWDAMFGFLLEFMRQACGSSSAGVQSNQSIQYDQYNQSILFLAVAEAAVRHFPAALGYYTAYVRGLGGGTLSCSLVSTALCEQVLYPAVHLGRAEFLEELFRDVPSSIAAIVRCTAGAPVKFSYGGLAATRSGDLEAVAPPHLVTSGASLMLFAAQSPDLRCLQVILAAVAAAGRKQLELAALAAMAALAPTRASFEAMEVFSALLQRCHVRAVTPRALMDEFDAWRAGRAPAAVSLHRS